MKSTACVPRPPSPSLVLAALAGCSLTGEQSDEPTPRPRPTRSSWSPTSRSTCRRSWSGRSRTSPATTWMIRAAGDAGALTTKLVLTADNPTGDVAFGVDNTFASRALDEGVFAEYDVDAAGRRRRVRARRATRRPAVAGRQRQRLRQRRRHLVRRARPRPAGDPRGPHRPGVPGPVRHPVRARPARPGMAFLLATVAEYGDDWPAYWERLIGQRRARRRRLVGRLLRRVHPGRRQAATARSCCPTTPRPRSPSRRARTSRRPAPCSTPASARSSTPACWPAPTTPRAAGRCVEFLLSDEVQAALPDEHVRLPGRRLRRAARRLGEVRRAARRAVRRGPGRDRREPRRPGCEEWRDVTTR